MPSSKHGLTKATLFYCQIVAAHDQASSKGGWRSQSEKEIPDLLLEGNGSFSCSSLDKCNETFQATFGSLGAAIRLLYIRFLAYKT